MKNAHERLGTVTFSKHTQNSSTNVSTHCDRYAINSDGYLQVLSIFGNDAEVAAVHGAIMKANSLRIRFPEAKDRYAGERGIGNPGPLQVNRFSRPPQSTTLPSLRRQKYDIYKNNKSKMKQKPALPDTCEWPSGDPLMIEYHNLEWGVPVHDDRKHFEFILLDCFQAG